MSTTGTSDEWVFRKVLAHYKTDYKALEAAGFKFFRGSYAEQASQFKDRNVDSVFTFLAVPAAAVTEASVGRSLKIMNFPSGPSGKPEQVRDREWKDQAGNLSQGRQCRRRGNYGYGGERHHYQQKPAG